MNVGEDTYYLRLLSIFHYVLAGMLALLACFPILHFAIGIAILTGAFEEPGKGDAPPVWFGWMFVLLPGLMMLCGWALAVCVGMAGRQLRRHRSYTFCLVIAGIECIFMPMGTVLGVFTIIVLIRPGVKSLFGVAELASS